MTLLPLCLLWLFPWPQSQGSLDAKETGTVMLTLSWGCSLGRWNSLLQMEENRLANSLMSPAPEEPLPPGCHAPK